MADTATTTSAVPEDETPNQKQARLRREKRQAKLAATGEERLARIKGLNGGVAPPDEVLGGPTAAPATKKNATVADDPDEVDISDHPYTPRNNGSGSGTPSGTGFAAAPENPLAQAMMQMQADQQQRQSQGQGAEEDPMAKMMQQMMGLMGGDPNNPNASPQDGDPLQMLSTMMGAAGGMGMGGGGPQQKQPSSGSAYLWRIVHTISALGIAGYIALTSTFNGSLLSRSDDLAALAGGGVNSKLFYLFATVEVVLQSTRYFMEKGQLQGSGWLATIANSGFVPPPYAQYIRTIGRYMTIWSTVVSDAMVVVFVLGVMAWWRGMAVA